MVSLEWGRLTALALASLTCSQNNSLNAVGYFLLSLDIFGGFVFVSL